jgi:hypothetical protein
LAKAIARPPDVVVTETRIPGINGFDLCHLLRRDVSTRGASIVVVTGDAFESDVARAQDAGADAVLIKPCLPEVLTCEIQRLLDLSATLRERARLVREKAGAQLERSGALFERAASAQRRVMLSRSHQRQDTTTPPAPPPTLVCPRCDQPLHYERSHIGGVSARNPEQWDYFQCVGGCGTFQYRQRTRKLRQV